jgi:ribose transport system ATP-binding protein
MEAVSSARAVAPVANRSASHETSALTIRRLSKSFGATQALNPVDRGLPGGNQQKGVMARWMHLDPAVLILEDPTDGIEVGAKAEIYRLLAAQLARGQDGVLVSTDFEEVAAICHRALVFRDGANAGAPPSGAC